MRDFQTILFLCTGNFYRSRFAEAYFNHHARETGLSWRATSRGFRPHLATEKFSHLAAERLDDLNIPTGGSGPGPLKLEESDLAIASIVVALYEDEHRPMLDKRFPRWTDRVNYWQIPDIDIEPASIALPKIEAEVDTLIVNLESGHALGAGESVLVEF